ncbi:MAG: hypothetical protein LBP59_17390 [Planctomycetaceae bacterium]|nr:hypothetical protein [Planctomycetaceae bacterium]
MRLYSTADERGFDRNRFIGCLSAKCRRDASDPVVSPASRLTIFCYKKYLSHLPR